jgi:ribosome recycling factor
MLDDKISKDAEERMKKAVEALHREFSTIRTGRATPTLLEKITVEAYGSTMGLRDLANISVPEARMLVIHPYDKSIMGAIEKAIQKSELGIHPTNDGNVIRLIFPPLTEERRRDLVKVIRKKTEDGKVALRNIRRDAMEQLKALEKKGASEDEVKRAQDGIQKLTDRFIKEFDDILAAKEKEIMEI